MCKANQSSARCDGVINVSLGVERVTDLDEMMRRWDDGDSGMTSLSLVCWSRRLGIGGPGWRCEPARLETTDQCGHDVYGSG